MMLTVPRPGKKPKTPSAHDTRRSPKPPSGEATATAESLSPKLDKPTASPPALTARKPPNTTPQAAGGLNHAQSEKTH